MLISLLLWGLLVLVCCGAVVSVIHLIRFIDGKEIVVAGRIIRCTIDAVLDTSAVPGMKPVTIVDWKSGRRPSAHQVDSRELQLALYRLAWARSRRMPLEDIGACFVYLREKQGRQVLQAGNLSEAEVSKRIEESLPRAS